MLRHPLVRSPIASLMLGLTLGACSNFRVDTPPTPAVVATNPKYETIRVKTRDARIVVVSEPRLERDTLFGYSSSGAFAADRPVALPVRDVEPVSTRHFNALKSVGLVVGVIVPACYGALLWR